MKLTKSQLREIIREELQENNYPDSKEKEIKKWADELVKLLRQFNFSTLSLPYKIIDIKIEHISLYYGNVIAKTQKINDLPQFEFFFNIEWTGRTWELTVTLSSPQKRGYHTKKATGGNATPRNAIQIIKNILNK